MKKIFIFFIAIFSAFSCSDYLDVNDDPDNPTTATVELAFPSGVSSVAFILGGQYQILGSLWSQHWTQSVGANQFSNVDNYNIDNSDYDREYDNLYSDGLIDLKFVADKAKEAEDWNHFLMAEVMTAFTFQLLVDLHDEVPYFEALQGATGNTTPKFDSGADIYPDLIARIDAALANDLDAITSVAVGTEDFVFDGDMDQWIRFANTLKLRMYLRQSEINASAANTGISAMFNAGVEFLEIDAEMNDFSAVQNFENPFYATQVSTQVRGFVDIAASNTTLNFLQNNSDPRLNALYATPVAGGPHISIDQGDFNNQSFFNSQDLSQPIIPATHPVVFLSAAESKFLQAEAVVRFGVTGDAQQLYNEGIDASFTKLGVTGSAAMYGTGGAYEFNASGSNAEKIEQIIVQKWLSMANFQGIEAFLEQSRTGYPDFFTVTPNNVTGGKFPKRLPIPQVERERNRDNLPTAKTVSDRVWWDPS